MNSASADPVSPSRFPPALRAQLSLGMLNFVDMDKDKRCDFAFRIFDEDGSGLLEMDELVAILSANHMQVRRMCWLRRGRPVACALAPPPRSAFFFWGGGRKSAAAVAKKAETIMKTADADGNGELSLEEFRIVAQKFPNILFPAFTRAAAKAGADAED
jgi:Ca2+-binding EF-hand superfamily protein